MSKHTEGPWVRYRNVIVAGKYMDCGEPDLVVTIEGMSEEQETADAMLITAAPDMYEALKSIEKMIVEEIGNIGMSVNFSYVRKALAKAEGREPDERD